MQPQAFRGTNRDIERIAEQIRSNLAAANVHGSSALLKEMVARAGGEIVVIDNPTYGEVNGGSLEIRGERDFTIRLSPFTSPLRDNFTIAHELGHYVLHFYPVRATMPTPLKFGRYGTGPLESQANRFAAALLMPAAQFREKYQAVGGDPYTLAGSFGVSVPAIEVRVKDLGLTVA